MGLCVGGQYYLGFRMLAWSPEEEEAPARDVGQEVVTRRGRVVGVMLDRHRQGGGGTTWGSVC